MQLSTPSVIEVSGLRKSYGSVLALDSLSFTVPPGCIAGFVGPNGSGKTTTIRTLLGLIRPTAGTAKVFGLPIAKPHAYIKRVGALIEAPVFYPSLSGRTNLSTLATLGGHDQRRVSELIELVGLKGRDRDKVGGYSLGMRQRLGIAAGLLGDPDLLVLDEPANGLDPHGIIEMRELMLRLRASGKTLFISSHLLAEVEQVADWLVVLKEGKALYCGPAKQLPGSDGVEIVVETAAPEQLEVVAKIAHERGYPVSLGTNQLHITAPAEFSGELNRLAMNAGAEITELHRAQATLEATFLRMISEGVS